MNVKNLIALFILCFAISPLTAIAAGDVTMQVVDDENFAEEKLVFEIPLPGKAPVHARDNPPAGADIANAARELGREFGQARAAEARELGRGDPGERPDIPASPPGPPTPPGPPNPPGPPSQ